jgi:hypothetical protein
MHSIWFRRILYSLWKRTASERLKGSHTFKAERLSRIPPFPAAWDLRRSGSALLGGFESVARVTASGLGTLTAGVEEVAQAGTAVSGIALSGTYSIASNGRGTAQLTGGGGTSNLNLLRFQTHL